MYLGKYQSNITNGRRIAVPSKIRRSLGKKFIIAKWYEECLVLISVSEWSELLKKITGKSELLTRSVRDTDRFIMGSAFELEIDSQGRVVLPEDLSNYAKIDKSVIFLGLGDRVEIWDEKVWKIREEYISKNAADLMEELANDGK
jgi:MraZ protein